MAGQSSGEPPADGPHGVEEDPILIRRAEVAEANASALEESLAGAQVRLQQAERQYADASLRLAEREQELRRTSERLDGGERELRAVSDRLQERERELGSLTERMARREADLHAISGRLEERERQLRLAEEELSPRLAQLERRIGEVQGELASERQARLAAERELERMRMALGKVAPMVAELRHLATSLRAAAASEEATAIQEESQGPAAEPAAEEATAIREESQGPAAEPALAEEAPGSASAGAVAAGEPPRQEAIAEGSMAEALAAAVERLRARVAVERGEDQEDAATVPEAGTAELPPDAGSVPERVPERVPEVFYQPPEGAVPESSPSWLAGAIRRVVERQGSKLGGELVLELLPAQALVAPGPLTYTARIAEVGDFAVRLERGEATVSRLDGAEGGDWERAEPALEGDLAAFAEIVAGGMPRSRRARRKLGLRVRGGDRSMRRLLAARRRPVTIAEIADAGIAVWPGLLLAALAEAIDPAWVGPDGLKVAFAMEGYESSLLMVEAREGQGLRVTRTTSAGEDGSGGAGNAEATVRLGEREFAAMLSGRPLDEGRGIVVEGRLEALEQLLAWTDRVQGIVRRFNS